MRHILVALSFLCIMVETSATVAPGQGIEVVDLDEMYKTKMSEAFNKIKTMIPGCDPKIKYTLLEFGPSFGKNPAVKKDEPLFQISGSEAEAILIFLATAEDKANIWLKSGQQGGNKDYNFLYDKPRKLLLFTGDTRPKTENDLDVNAKLKELINDCFKGVTISGPGKVVDENIEFKKQSGDYLEKYSLDYFRAKLIGDIAQKDPPGKDKYFYTKHSRFSYKALFKVSKASDGKIALTFLESYQDGFVAGVKGVKKTGYSIQNGTYDFEVLNDPTKYQYTYVKSYWYPPASQRVIASKKQVGSELKENIAAQILALRDRAKSDPAAKVVLDAMGSGTDDGTSYKIHIKSDQAGTLSIVNVEKAVAQKA